MATKGTILVGTIGQSVMTSADEGATWTRASVRQGMHSDCIVKALASDPRQPQTVYAGTEGAFARVKVAVENEERAGEHGRT